MRTRSHALVVGGTGMLRGVALHLAGRGMEVSVVARSTDRLRRLAADADGAAGAVHSLAVDYRDTDRLLAGLASARKACGPVSLAVLWVHAVATEAPAAIADAIASPKRARLFHLRGSARHDPSAADDPVARHLAGHPGVRYREVVLGFAGPAGRTRWLTDAEISAAVVGAIEEDASRTVIGRVEPWSDRPGA